MLLFAIDLGSLPAAEIVVFIFAHLPYLAPFLATFCHWSSVHFLFNTHCLYILLQGQECHCKCSAGFACADCSKSTTKLLSGKVTCGCDGIKCPAAKPAGLGNFPIQNCSVSCENVTLACFTGLPAVSENANGQCNPRTGTCDCYWSV